MVMFFKTITDFDVQREYASYLIRLLKFVCKNKDCKQRLLSINAISHFLPVLRLSLQKMTNSYSAAAEDILLIMGSLFREASAQRKLVEKEKFKRISKGVSSMNSPKLGSESVLQSPSTGNNITYENLIIK
jgi:hypothetical protein